MTHFDVIVVGAGMWGASAARHLAGDGRHISLIGPGEPANWQDHQGVFSAHYDAARITRRNSPKPDWVRFADRSISRYGDIENAGGIRFHHRVGCLLAGAKTGPKSDYMRNTLAIVEQLKLDGEVYEGAPLAEKFPYLAFPENIIALHEQGDVGWINPRDFVACEIAAAVKGGVTHIKEEVKQVSEDGQVLCRSGQRYSADQVIIACGLFSDSDGLAPQPVPLKSYARTVTHFVLDEAELQRLSAMPSIIYGAPDGSADVYILPPARYPDGSVAIKIGGDPTDIELTTREDKIAWFQSGGNADVAAFLTGVLEGLIPDLRYTRRYHSPCSTCFTPSGNPLIYKQSDQVTILTGGNGAGAKGADEIGRLGALVALNGRIEDEGFENGFGPEATASADKGRGP